MRVVSGGKALCARWLATMTLFGLVAAVAACANGARPAGAPGAGAPGAVTPAAAPSRAPVPEAPITIAAVGDIMLGSDWPDWRDLPPNNGAGLLRPVTPILARADLAFGNLEGPLVDGGKPLKATGAHSFAFRVPTRSGAHLRSAGFDVLSLANNHASDFGARGRASTRRTLDRLGIAHAGDKGTVAVRTVRGRRVAFVAFAHNNVAHNVNDVAGARRVIGALAASGRADLIVVSFHGGGEGAGFQRVGRGPERFLGEARGDLRRFSHAAIDAGADLVLGHGPHVVRGMEVYRRRLIAYSLGNFATYGKFGLRGPTALSLILEARLSPENGSFRGGRVYPAIQRRPGGPRLDPDRAVIPVLRRLSQDDFGKTAVRINDDGALSPP